MFVFYNVKYIDAKYNDNNMGDKLKILSICFDSNYNDNILLGKYFEKKYNDNIDSEKKLEFNSKYFVDATGDANFSEIVGAKFLPAEKTQATSLRFIMGNVNKEAFVDWIMAYDTNRNVTTSCTAEGELHFSTAYTWDSSAKWALEPLFNKAVIEGPLKDTDRAYFQVFSIAGEPDKVAFNCPRLFVDEGFDVFSSTDKFAYSL